MQNAADLCVWGGGGRVVKNTHVHIILLRAYFSHNVNYWYEIIGMKYVMYWYQFLTRCEKLVSIFTV